MHGILKIVKFVKINWIWLISLSNYIILYQNLIKCQSKLCFLTKSRFHKIFMYQNFVMRLSNLCDETQTFWHRLVDLTFVTHSPTSLSERPHSSDIDSWKNEIKIHHIDHQNVNTKSPPKNVTITKFKTRTRHC